MSSYKPSQKRSARVVGKKASNMKSSPTQAKQFVRSTNRQTSHQASPSTHQQSQPQPQPDSGFFDGSDGESYHHDSGKSFEFKFSNNKDWDLYADEPLPGQDSDYYFNVDEAVDIASTKANHGSLYNGTNNQEDTLIATRSDSPALDVIHENPQGADPPHRFTHHPATQYSTTQLQTYMHSVEQHEFIAYLFEQPPCPARVFQDLQSWPEEIDLDFYAVLF